MKTPTLAQFKVAKAVLDTGDYHIHRLDSRQDTLQLGITEAWGGHKTFYIYLDRKGKADAVHGFHSEYQEIFELACNLGVMRITKGDATRIKAL